MKVEGAFVCKKQASSNKLSNATGRVRPRAGVR